MVILSDLSETFTTGITKMHERVGQFYGPRAREWFVSRSKRMNNLFLELMRGEMTERAYWEIFCDTVDKPEVVIPTGLMFLFSQEIRGKIPGTREVIENIIAYPRSLRQADSELIPGRPEIIMVSDHIRERAEEVKTYHPEVFSLFSHEIWSFDRGEVKSDPGFFGRLLADLGIRAREALFIDDLLVNCNSACTCRIKAIRFTNVSDLIRSLEDNRFVIDSKVKAKYLSRVG